jgi:hypothetical protein
MPLAQRSGAVAMLSAPQPAPPPAPATVSMPGLTGDTERA